MTAKSFLVKPLPISAITASVTAAGYDAANMLNDYLGVVWKSTAGSARYLDIDLGADTTFDFVALLGCTSAFIGWTLQVMVATAAQGPSFATRIYDSATGTFLAGATPLPSGRGVGWHDIPSPVTGRYIRLSIVTAAGSVVTAGRIVIGKRIIPEREFVFGAAFGVRDLGSFDLSARGVPLWRRNKAKLRTLGISYANAYKSEVETALLPLVEEVGNEMPVFVCTDGTADTQRQRRCYYGPLQGELGAIWARAAGFEFRVNMVSLI